MVRHYPAAMDVIDAVNRRMSVRQFTSEPVPDEVLRGLVADSARAPSGGNLQPWRIYAINGESMVRFLAHLEDRPLVEEPEYPMYPAGLVEPYRTNRFRIGEMMYETLRIPREDKSARMAQVARNNVFFDAPAAIFCFVDRQMDRPQWSDLGMYLQTFMLLAVERGLATCPQEYWSLRHRAVSDFVGAPENEMLFCGIAIGHADDSAPINSLRSHRMDVDHFARFV